MEKELADHCRNLDKRFYGITRKQIMVLAYEYAVANGVSSRFNSDKTMAGKDWLNGFCKRQNLSLRTPQQCSLNRALGFNKVQCERFFDNLKECYVEKGFRPHRVFNMDESGISTVPNKTPKVISSKGKKGVCKVSSGERGETVTAVCCVSATGIYIPPALIFPRKRMNDALFADAPVGSLKLISDTGYMTSDLFLQWLEHFATHAKPCSNDAVLLVMDNHASHCSLASVMFCREHHITLLTLPPHASHVLQPLDKGFFGPLKTAYSAEVEKWMVNHHGQRVTLYQISGLFKAAYSRTATVEKAEKAFAATGISPFNPDVITQDQFAPSLVTHRDSEDLQQPQMSNSENDISDEIASLQSTTDALENGNENVVAPKSNSTLGIRVSVTELSPIPKCTVGTKRKRQAQKSEIISSSPYKKILEEKERKKNKERTNTERPNSKKGKLARRRLELQSPKPSTSASPPPSSEPTASQEETECPGCQESYDGEWVQCGMCSSWWHEIC